MRSRGGCSAVAGASASGRSGEVEGACGVAHAGGEAAVSAGFAVLGAMPTSRSLTSHSRVASAQTRIRPRRLGVRRDARGREAAAAGVQRGTLAGGRVGDPRAGAHAGTGAVRVQATRGHSRSRVRARGAPRVRTRAVGAPPARWTDSVRVHVRGRPVSAARVTSRAAGDHAGAVPG